MTIDVVDLVIMFIFAFMSGMITAFLLMMRAVMTRGGK